MLKSVTSISDVDFAPVEDLAGTMRALSEPRWGRTVDALGEDLRISAKLLKKTKAELVNNSRKFGDDNLLELIDSLHQSAELFKSYAALAGAAEVRLLVAASIVAAEVTS